MSNHYGCASEMHQREAEVQENCPDPYFQTLHYTQKSSSPSPDPHIIVGDIVLALFSLGAVNDNQYNLTINDDLAINLQDKPLWGPILIIASFLFHLTSAKVHSHHNLLELQTCPKCTSCKKGTMLIRMCFAFHGKVSGSLLVRLYKDAGSASTECSPTKFGKALKLLF